MTDQLISRISDINSKKLSDYGKKIYQSNTTMHDIANVMEHPLFADFFNKYFQDKFDIEATVKMLLLYKKIEKITKDPHQKIALLYEIMSNGQLRQKVLFESINSMESIRAAES